MDTVEKTAVSYYRDYPNDCNHGSDLEVIRPMATVLADKMLWALLKIEALIGVSF